MALATINCSLTKSVVVIESSGRAAAPASCHFSAGVAAVVETRAVSLVSTTISHAPLARFWREVHGANDWEYLVQPLHPLLRSEIVRYGKLVMACYRAFDLDPASKRYLQCRYGKQNLLREAALEDSGYEVTKYIYATPDNNSCARWIGYVAVSSDEAVGTLGRRDVLVTFRGAVTSQEWGASLASSLTPAKLNPHDPHPDVRVESGFLSIYTSDGGNRKFPPGSCRQQLLSEVSRLVKAHAGEELGITLSGHSMGSALAALLAYDISELGLNKPDNDDDNIPVTVFSFGGPRVGDGGFKKRLHELGVKVLRIVNVNDPIPRIPGVVFNENLTALATKYEVPWSFASCHAHVGVEVVLDFFDARNPARVHDLGEYVDDLLKCPEESADRVRDGAWILQNMTATLTKKLLETLQAHVHALVNTSSS